MAECIEGKFPINLNAGSQQMARRMQLLEDMCVRDLGRFLEGNESAGVKYGHA
jgi:hypothetical protein